MIDLEATLYLLIGLFGGRIASDFFMIGYVAPNNLPLLKYGVPTLGYLFDVITIFGFLGFIFLRYRGASARQRLRYILSAAAISIIVGNIYLAIGHATYSRQFGMYDGAVQTQVAAEGMLHGQDPYTTDYRHTEFQKYLRSVNMDVAPMLDHYAYPPLVPLLTVPTIWLGQFFHIEPPVQLVGILAAVLCSLMLLWVTAPNRRPIVALLTLFNPLVFMYPMMGFNDAIYVLFSLATVTAFWRGRWKLAGVAMGLSLAAKQTAWLFLPLWGVYLWTQYRSGHITMRQIWHVLIPTAITVLVLFGPWLIHNPAAMYDDLVRFVTSSLPGLHSTTGISLWQMLVLVGRVSNIGEWLPATYVMTFVAAITFPILWRIVFRQPTVSRLVVTMVIAVFIFGMFNRYFYEHYIGSFMLFVVAAMVYWEQEPAQAYNHDVDNPKTGNKKPLFSDG